MITPIAILLGLAAMMVLLALLSESKNSTFWFLVATGGLIAISMASVLSLYNDDDYKQVPYSIKTYGCTAFENQVTVCFNDTIINLKTEGTYNYDSIRVIFYENIIYNDVVDSGFYLFAFKEEN